MERLKMDNSEEESSSVVFRDTILNTFLGIIFIFILLIPFINPPKNKETEDMKNRDEMIVEMIWDNEVDIDMDVWVQAPDEPPVGFSNKRSLTVDLLRDDLGLIADISSLNYEYVFVRKLKQGEYIINAHSFRWNAPIDELKVEFIITIHRNEGKITNKEVFKRTLKFTGQGQEKTVLRFEIDEQGKVIRDSINYDFISLLRKMDFPSNF